MRLSVRRIAVASAAAYLLAGWLAAALHSHGHAHAGHAEAEEVCTTCSCGHQHGPAKKGPQKEEHAGHDHESPACPDGGCPDGEHHHCVVCDFLAKPPVATAAVTLDAGSEPAVEAAEPLPPAYEPVIRIVSRSRGPPVA